MNRLLHESVFHLRPNLFHHLVLLRASTNVGKEYLRNPRVYQKRLLRSIHTMFQKRYQFCDLDDTENVELYRPGGLHPVAIGDVFANGRYKVLHKLGHGGSSTVWLARDQPPQSSVSATLVALRILSADQSCKPKDEIPDLVIPSKLNAFARASHSSNRCNVLTVEDNFMEEGPNGTHLCIVSQLAGPSVASMPYSKMWFPGSKRLRADLARKVAKQTATVVELMHSAGIVHGDLTPYNILFQVTDKARRWSDSEIYSMLGELETEEVQTLDHSPPEPHAPRELVAPVDSAVYSSTSLLEENIVAIDFGHSFDINARPKDYRAGTLIHYFSPEARFDHIVSPASDIWGLACTIYEIRAGCPLFSTFLGNHAEALQDTVLTLGKLPEPWWSAFLRRYEWFEENGEPKAPLTKSPIREKLQTIGNDMRLPLADDGGPMLEPIGTMIEEEEIGLLSDLLEKMLKYRPEERITIQEVLRHPWFGYGLLPNT